MAAIGACEDTTDAIDLFEPQGLFLKPIAKVNISVQLPQMKTPGKSISNWEVMEKLKKLIKPDQFIMLKVVKSTLEFVRFEGEIENKGKIKVLIQRLDGKTMKLSGFPDALKVRSAEAKPQFPSRHDWESYFRDAKNMNEMKPGERPDTIHIQSCPCKWIGNRKDKDKNKPSEYIVKKIFESYGEIRCTDIPMLDPYRKEMSCANSKALQTFSFGQDITCEVYIQYKDYIGFVKAMTALRGMKLMYKAEDGKAFTANVKVDFDKSKHLADKNIKRRRVEREKLVQLVREREERVKKEREEEERKKQEERDRKEADDRDREQKREEKLRRREDRRLDRENQRKHRRQEKKAREEEKKMQHKIALEERRILIAQRKLETIRLLSDLFTRIKVDKQEEEVVQREKELEEEHQRQIDLEQRLRLEQEQRKIDLEKRKKESLVKQEKELREKILKNMKAVEEKRAEKQREELRKKISGKTRLKSAVIMQK